MSNPVKVMITIDPCCERLKYLSDILFQARNLNLNESYMVAIENVILDMMPNISVQNEEAIITIYDNNIDNILSLRDTAFNEWMVEVKTKFTPVPKTVIPE
jgi:hypothetical protein